METSSSIFIMKIPTLDDNKIHGDQMTQDNREGLNNISYIPDFVNIFNFSYF